LGEGCAIPAPAYAHATASAAAVQTDFDRVGMFPPFD
jgi:hypothetical protein